MSVEVISRDGGWYLRTEADQEEKCQSREDALSKAAAAGEPDAPVIHERSAHVVAKLGFSSGKD